MRAPRHLARARSRAAPSRPSSPRARPAPPTPPARPPPAARARTPSPFARARARARLGRRRRLRGGWGRHSVPNEVSQRGIRHQLLVRERLVRVRRRSVPFEPCLDRGALIRATVRAHAGVDHERLGNRTYEVLWVRRVFGGRLGRRRSGGERRRRRDSGWGRRERRRRSGGGSGRRSALGIHRPPATSLTQPRRHAVAVLI